MRRKKAPGINRIVTVVTPIEDPGVQVVYFPRSTYSKMLAKIPFILLATWGIYMSCKPPHPQPPQRERFPLSVPHWQWLENSGYVQWAPVIIRVSNYA